MSIFLEVFQTSFKRSFLDCFTQRSNRGLKDIFEKIVMIFYDTYTKKKLFHCRYLTIERFLRVSNALLLIFFASSLCASFSKCYGRKQTVGYSFYKFLCWFWLGFFQQKNTNYFMLDQCATNPLMQHCSSVLL